jgi:hypothetical protein
LRPGCQELVFPGADHLAGELRLAAQLRQAPRA